MTMNLFWKQRNRIIFILRKNIIYTEANDSSVVSVAVEEGRGFTNILIHSQIFADWAKLKTPFFCAIFR